MNVQLKPFDGKQVCFITSCLYDGVLIVSNNGHMILIGVQFLFLVYLFTSDQNMCMNTNTAALLDAVYIMFSMH